MSEDRLRELLDKRDRLGLSVEEASELGALEAVQIAARPRSTTVFQSLGRNQLKWVEGEIPRMARDLGVVVDSVISTGTIAPPGAPVWRRVLQALFGGYHLRVTVHSHREEKVREFEIALHRYVAKVKEDSS